MALAVVDASVVAKWFLQEENTLSARRLREDFLEGSLRLRVPSLLPFEVLNALKYNPNFPSRGLFAASRALDAAGLLTVPVFGEYAERTVAIASRFDLTIYDAAYVALADIADCTLYTADEQLDLLGRHGERRTQENRRAIVVDGDPQAFVPEAFPDRLDPPPCGMQFAALAPPVPEQLHGDQEALASHLSHQGRMVLSKAVEFRAQAPPDRSASLDQSFRLEDPDDLPRGGAAERVPAKGEAVGKPGLPELVAPGSLEQDRSKRRVASRQPFREHDGVGLQTAARGSEPPSRPTEARDDLVGHELDVVPIAEFADPLREVGGERHGACDAHHRLDDDARERPGPVSRERPANPLEARP